MTDGGRESEASAAPLPRRWGLAAAAVVCWAVAMPPAWFAGAEFAVLASLAAFYACVSSTRSPLLLGYTIGVARMAWIAWSLIPVTGLGPYVAIVLLGAVYDLLIAVWTRAGGVRFGAVTFGAGVAATAWMRAHMPEISYPHGQAAHALFEWPALLGPVTWGGEVLANWVFASCAAAVVACVRSWRVGVPDWRGARSTLGIVAGLWLVTCVVSPPRAAHSTDGDGAPRPTELDVLLFETGPGLHRSVDGRVQDNRSRYASAVLLPATQELAGLEVADPPDMVVWPESSVPRHWVERRPPLQLARGTQLIGGRVIGDPDRRVEVSAALQFASNGRVLGWHEKQEPVPAAERLPLLDIAPEWFVEWATGIVGYEPRLGRGTERPPLIAKNGAAFAALTCFDNAFDDVARRAVASGAQLLLVVSNEVWYEQGAELDQMVAMSVFRALESGTPVARSTVDGRTLVVDARGYVTHSLPAWEGEQQAPPRTLRVDIALGPGGLGALAWLHGLFRWLAFCALGFVLLRPRPA